MLWGLFVSCIWLFILSVMLLTTVLVYDWDFWIVSSIACSNSASDTNPKSPEESLSNRYSTYISNAVLTWWRLQ